MGKSENLKWNIAKYRSIRSTVMKLVKKIDRKIQKEENFKPEIVKDFFRALLEYKLSLENLGNLIESEIKKNSIKYKE